MSENSLKGNLTNEGTTYWAGVYESLLGNIRMGIRIPTLSHGQNGTIFI